MHEKNVQILTVEAGRSEKHYWKDLWRYRELLFFLSWRDILVRYKQTVFGIAWSIIRPLIALIIFTVFSMLANFPSYDVPRPIFVFLAVIIWQFFANAFSETSNSLINNAAMISKVYFPRIIFPISSCIVSLIDFLISFSLLCALMIFYKFLPSINIIFFPLFLFLTFMLSIGSGLLIASLNVKFRDFRYIVPFIVQIGLYISPVSFSSMILPEKYRIFYSLNPFVGIIEGARWAVTGKTTLDINNLIISVIFTFIFLFAGILYFRKTEKSFADII